MLIDFTIKNYTSFKDEKFFSFLCSSTKVKDNVALISLENDKYKVYPFSVLLGPNASGKTNLMKALYDFREFIINSYKAPKDEIIKAYKPYKLNTNSKESPISIDMEFTSKENHYSYNVVFTKDSIISEELYLFNNGVKLTKSFLFKRKGNDVVYGVKVKGEKTVFNTLLLPNRLLLSVIGGNSTTGTIQNAYQFFKDELIILFPQNEIENQSNNYSTNKLLKDNLALKNLIIAMLKAADIQISDIVVKRNKRLEDLWEKVSPNSKEPDSKDIFIESLLNQTFFAHPLYNDNQELVASEYLDFENSESSGTHKLYILAGAILLSLINGTPLIIDELSSCLHPNIELFIVKLFLSKEININGAQLLVNTHNISLIDSGDLTREQVWFTDKNNYGESDLFCLDEFDKNKIRDYAKYGKNYLENRIGGLPNICFEIFKKELNLYYAKKEK